MSDSDREADKLLADENPQPMDTNTGPGDRVARDKGTDSLGVADAVSLLQSALSNQFASLSKQLFSEQNVNAQSLSKKLKDKSTTKFKGEGNRIQFEFNEEILELFRQSIRNRVICTRCSQSHTRNSRLALTPQ